MIQRAEPYPIGQAEYPESSFHRRFILSVLLGLFGFAGSFFSPVLVVQTHTISITWFHIFPLLAAMAYGAHYGFLSGVIGLAVFTPFLTWPSNGWANIVPVILYSLFYVWHGYNAQARRGESTLWNNPFIAQLFFSIAYGAAIFFLYPVLFRLNPPFWLTTAVSHMPGVVIIEIIIKSTATMFGCVLVAAFIFMIPSVKRMLGIQSPNYARFNGMIFLACNACIIGVWLIWVTLNSIFVHKDFPEGVLKLDAPHEIITLFVLTVTCLIGGYVIALFMERRIMIEEQIVLAKEDWESTFDTITDMITIHDRDFNVIRANPAAKAILGLQFQGELSLAKCFNYYHGTDKPPTGCASCQCLQTRKPFTSEIFEPYLNKHLEISAIPRFGTSGQLVGLIHVTRDITKQKQSEEKILQTLESLRKAMGTTIQVMVSTVEARDPYTAGHQLRSANLARAIAMEMGLPQDKMDGIRLASSIHDIGKLSIPAELLSKPTKLTEIELSLIKEHAQKGFEILKDVESPWPLAEIVLQHHERMDGSGYPRNLKGDEILIEARILSVADVVEAMASHRPYRPAIGIEAALEEIGKNSGILYDKTASDACLKLFREKDFKLEDT